MGSLMLRLAEILSRAPAQVSMALLEQAAVLCIHQHHEISASGAAVQAVLQTC